MSSTNGSKGTYCHPPLSQNCRFRKVRTGMGGYKMTVSFAGRPDIGVDRTGNVLVSPTSGRQRTSIHEIGHDDDTSRQGKSKGKDKKGVLPFHFAFNLFRLSNHLTGKEMDMANQGTPWHYYLIIENYRMDSLDSLISWLHSHSKHLCFENKRNHKVNCRTLRPNMTLRIQTYW